MTSHESRACPAHVRAALRDVATPVCAYVYDRAVLRDRAAALRAALPAGSLLLYAVKANGHPDVVATLASTCDGLEVASGGELALAAAAGAGQITFGGPAKTDGELAAAVAVKATVNVESSHELRRLDAIAQAAGATVAVALRVNRSGHTTLSSSHQMTGVPTPFGVDESDLAALIATTRDLTGVHLLGFHLHAVSNSLDADAHVRFIQDSVQWSVATARRHRVTLRLVNVGGGFGVDYTGDRAFDLAVLAGGLRTVAAALPPGARLAVEPGRFLAADAGWYAAEVIDVKKVHGRWFAVLRGGTHHFRLPAAWRYSHPFTVVPVEIWNYPFPRPGIQDREVDVVGELCTPNDVLSRGQRVGQLRAGDIVVFDRAGAYGWEISHHDYLRHAPPQMIIL